MWRSVALGFEADAFEAGRKTPVKWDEEFALNGHFLVVGKTGSGKTFTLRRIIDQLSRPVPGREAVRVHVFNVHGDIDLPQQSRVMFSESTPYGINPLRLSADPHRGGVRKCVQGFIEMINDSAPKSPLGARQVSALRNLLYDLFAERGFLVNDSSTWAIEDDGEPVEDGHGRVFIELPYEEKDLAKRIARQEGLTLEFDKESKLWWCRPYAGGLTRWLPVARGRRCPSVPDLAAFIGRRLRSLQVGGGSAAITLLERHNKRLQAWHSMLAKAGQSRENGEDISRLQLEIEEGAAGLIDTFSAYVKGIQNGRELELLARYESVDGLRSLKDRVETLVATGLFKPGKPPLDPYAPVWNYDLSACRDSEQRLFVWTRLSQAFEEAKQKGIVQGAMVRDVFIIDEADKFFVESDGNILNVLSNEARKFGIALVCASQAPGHFSEDFLGAVGVKVILGLDAQYRDAVVRKMRVPGAVFDYLVAKRVAAVQVLDTRDDSHRFVRTRVG